MPARTYCCFRFTLLIAVLSSVGVHAAQDEPQPMGAPADAPAAPMSEAERIARAYRTIDSTKKLVADLQAEVNDPQGEYQKCQESFVAVDEELQDKRQELESLKSDGKSEEAAAVEADIARVERKWKLIKERFELKIDERKQLLGQLDSLKQKLAKDQEALEKLLSPESEEKPAEQTGGPHGKSDTPVAHAPGSPRLF